jgi:hypothetical protein
MSVSLASPASAPFFRGNVWSSDALAQGLSYLGLCIHATSTAVPERQLSGCRRPRAPSVHPDSSGSAPSSSNRRCGLRDAVERMPSCRFLQADRLGSGVGQSGIPGVAPCVTPASYGFGVEGIYHAARAASKPLKPSDAAPGVTLSPIEHLGLEGVGFIPGSGEL